MPGYSKFSPVYAYKPFNVTGAGTLVPVGQLVSTTSATTITAGSGGVVTPTAMANILPGMWLNIANGTGTAEDVQVLSVTTTTFTANFLNNHSGAYSIISHKSTYLGNVIVNTPGSSVTLTLYAGNPNTLPLAGAAFASWTLAAGYTSFNCWCQGGLFYTCSGVCNVTLTYADDTTA